MKNRRYTQKNEERRENQKQLEYATYSKTIIIMAHGLRTLDISSMNPDSMRGEKVKRGIVKNLTMGKIHISDIQESHITQDGNALHGNYRIATASADMSKTTGVVHGGTAIMAQVSMQHHIAQIEEKSIRVLRATLDHAKSKIRIQILSTYAPSNGHAEEERRQHWGEVKETLNETCERHLLIWGADANGQLGRIERIQEEEKDTHGHVATRVIGPYAREEKRRRKNEMGYSYREYASDNR